MLYRILKIVIGIGIRLYYRKIKVNHVERLYKKGPKIIIANHPNTLLDAWIIGHLCKEPIYYMAKGTFFNTPLKRKVLNSLGLIPVNRSVDNKTKGVSNTEAFEMCYQVLEKGKTLVIFPEGNSNAERSLRMLKSGTARIALQTELRNQGKLGIQIIPIGLIYFQPEKFRSTVVANVGENIDPLEFLPEFEKDSLVGARKLTKEFRNGLLKLLVSSESKEQDTLADQIMTILSSTYTTDESKGVENEVSFLKSINERVNVITRRNPDKLEEIEHLVYQLNWQLDKLDVKSDFLDRNFKSGMFIRQILQSIVGLVMGLPIFIFGVIHNGVPYYGTDFLMPKLVESKEYYAPIAILLGIVLYPLNYVGFMWLLDYLFEPEWWVKLCYFISMPVTGLFAFYFYHYYKHITLKLSFTMLMKDKRETIEMLRKEKEILRKVLFN